MKRILFNIFSFIFILYVMLGNGTGYCGGANISYALQTQETSTIATEETTEPYVFNAEEFQLVFSTEYFKTLEYIEENDKEHCLLQINTCNDYINALQKAENSLSSEELEAVKIIIEEETQRVNGIIELYDQRIIELEKQAIWNKKEGEYPVAAKLWTYLVDDMGLNNYVAAGIMGNVMVETGGQTLNIEWNIYSDGKGYYGLCQWYIPYNPSMNGASFEEQCNYLNNSIKAEFDTFGSVCYQRGFDYEDFVQMEDVRAAALAFAKCYERCAATSYNYSSRQSCAEVAYNYFVD